MPTAAITQRFCNRIANQTQAIKAFMMKMGVMSTPALAIDDQVMGVGRMPLKAEIREWLGSQ